MKHFNKIFEIKRPQIPSPKNSDLMDIEGQMIVLESIVNKDIVLRGQFVLLQKEKSLLFLGTPWYGSMDQVKASNLTIDDFFFTLFTSRYGSHYAHTSPYTQ